MNSTHDPDRDSEGRREPETIIDISGTEPVVVEEDHSGYPSIAEGTERIRVFVASGGSRTCVIPAILILLLICCSCIAFWSLADNLF